MTNAGEEPKATMDTAASVLGAAAGVPPRPTKVEVEHLDYG
jgi:hypothetical protein